MKGHSSSRSGIRPSYGIMLIFAFGAAIIGAMAVHKLRETSFFNLLLKEKDRQIFSLQLLLQKERDYAKETKRETKEMKSKLYTLRAQKTDLDSSVLEMRSTISSLKDEQKAMEAALEEKQDELKFLREENPKLISLSEKLKEKEAEIEGLKDRIGEPVKVWSVVSDDPANLTLAHTNENENNWTRNGNGSRGEEEDSRKLEESIEGSRKDVEFLERKENVIEGRGNNNRVRKGKGKRGRRFVKDALEKIGKMEEKSEESELESKNVVVSNDQKERENLEVSEKTDEKVVTRKETGESENTSQKIENGTANQDSELPLNRIVDGERKEKVGEEKKVDDEETEESDKHVLKESESKLEQRK